MQWGWGAPRQKGTPVIRKLTTNKQRTGDFVTKAKVLHSHRRRVPLRGGGTSQRAGEKHLVGSWGNISGGGVTSQELGVTSMGGGEQVRGAGVTETVKPKTRSARILPALRAFFKGSEVINCRLSPTPILGRALKHSRENKPLTNDIFPGFQLIF